MEQLQCFNGIPFASWTSDFIQIVSLSQKWVGVVKTSLNRAYLIICIKLETRWSNYEQVEIELNFEGGPNSYVWQNIETICS